MAKIVEGVLVYDVVSDRYRIRQGLEEFSSGLHCGDTFQAMGKGDEWVDTRIEYDHDKRQWYLVGIDTEFIIDGIRVRYEY